MSSDRHREVHLTKPSREVFYGAVDTLRNGMVGIQKGG